ncbi:hypothetical protein HDU87_008725 [Geranomyces variabilis]|uniref:Uncharacterized protein n=1 Tax=Geranomyces variabilis TaxID=109894 RepID=A0AAD5TEZ9_9FUNG|nr:hypothetical protein HDU87_008725 [Geranomyces variabilis]
MLNNTPPLRTPLLPPVTRFTVETHRTAPLLPNKAIHRLVHLSLLHTLPHHHHHHHHHPCPTTAPPPADKPDDDAVISHQLAEFFHAAPGGSEYERYLHHLSTQSQVLSLALQLRADVTQGHYANITHLLALLYQSLFGGGGVNPRLLSLQARIAARFEEVKGAMKRVENGGESSLIVDEGLEGWLQALTTDIVQETLCYVRPPTDTPPPDLIPTVLARALRE